MAGENGGGQASGDVNFGYSAKTNKIGVSGWSKGNEVGNVSNTGVGERNEVTTTGLRRPGSWIFRQVVRLNRTYAGHSIPILHDVRAYMLDRVDNK
ncbi:hypothetical protein M6B38_106675 [Iris pallida]|uniref:Uncharacterized protein n=1 Tax=Iris pallida TaxID=29817 RepID=A0AAX6ES93_IRIPA|nr:hypothetical protein M6B38_106675 [Iris pallida]